MNDYPKMVYKYPSDNKSNDVSYGFCEIEKEKFDFIIVYTGDNPKDYFDTPELAMQNYLKKLEEGKK